MKKWLERTRLNEHISTYCMSMMVIYHLQVQNYLPSIETLQKDMLVNVLVGRKLILHYEFLSKFI